MILLIDNYDSFTYNLYQAIGQICGDVRVVRNDEITVDEIEQQPPSAIVVSPGPGYPKDAGISVEVIHRMSGKLPILGVCLGHQSIAQAFGGTIVPAGELMHGKASSITLDAQCPLFSNLPGVITAARYHSLIAEEASLPDCLSVTARDEHGQIMALAHKEHPTYGLQFHPESILTDLGKVVLENFLRLVKGITVTPLDTPLEQLPPAQRNALKPYIFKLIDGHNLTEEEAVEAMDCIMSDKATSAQIGSFLTALRMKGETIPEITGFARVMRQKANLVPQSADAIDIVGTGGDLANTFNISTTAAFVIAGAGARVAKHGNRSVSSRSGAADVLESLGVNISMTPAQALSCLDACGITFLFAPCFHASMKYAGPTRREIGVRSVFNILGPLSNPAMTDYIVLGVYEEALMEPMAHVLMNLGIRGAMLVHGNDGLDELSVSDKTAVCEIRGGKLIKYEINPADYGIPLAEKQEIVGGTAEENAQITLEILQGGKGPRRDIVALNAACALFTMGKAASIEEGLRMAAASIDSGAALEKLETLKAMTAAFH